MNEQQKAFLQLVAAPALSSQSKWQIPASITIAQAILESGWGKSQLFLRANNPFGIKVPLRTQSADEYEAYEAPTAEYLDHEWGRVSAKFMAFSSLDAAFLRHARLLWEAQFTPLIKALPGDPATKPRRVAQALQDCHYATDPNYAKKLMEIIREFHLDDGATLAALAQKPEFKTEETRA